MIKNKNGNAIFFSGGAEIKCPKCKNTWLVPDYNWNIYWCVACRYNEREWFKHD